MDRTLDVRTPESIAFSYELAGLGSRFLAVILDLLVQFGILGLISYGVFLGATHLPKTKAAAHAAAASVQFFENIVIAGMIFLVFAIFFGYFIAFEAFWNGQTPGKRALGLRVVRDGGYPLDFTGALVRNVIRVGEMIAGFYALSAIVALASTDNKRIGDLAAGTIVVRETKMESPSALLRDLREEPVYAATQYLSGEERALVKRFLDRRDRLTAERRAVLAHEIAERVRARLPETMQRLDDEALLERL